MIERYLTGVVAQALERARQLLQIVQGQYPREYDGLRQICLTRLDTIRRELQQLAQESIVDPALQTPRRVRHLKRIVEQINKTESVGAFALRRTCSDDDVLNRLITAICNDIAYPLIRPTISQMSQDYFHIYTEFNLLCMPLIEGRFLLHLPDIYHELCHPLHSPQNAGLPSLEPYHDGYADSLFAVAEHFSDEIVAAERIKSPRGTIYQLQLWRTCWIKYWMEEYFCDLFGVLTAGPAYAWAHFHLCAERGGDPFDTPLMFASSHPADAARMKAMLKVLRAIGFETQGNEISVAWSNLETAIEAKPTAEYSLCHTDAILSQIVSSALRGVSAIGVKMASPQSMTPTVAMLNEAWTHFWRDPSKYAYWEAKRVDSLRSGSDGTKAA